MMRYEARFGSAHTPLPVRRWPLLSSLGLPLLAGMLVLLGSHAAAQPVPTERPSAQAPAALNTLSPDRRRELQHLLDDLRDPDLALERRQRAAAILLDRDWSAAVQSLRRLLIGGAHESTLRAIAQAVAEEETPDEQLVPALLELLKRDEAELRRDVAAALGRFDSDRLRGRLIELATDEQNPTPLRLGAIRALAEHRTRPAAKALLKVAESGGPAERQTAFESLAQLTGLEELGEDLEAWQRWWKRARERSERRWLTMLMRNLSARNAKMLERLRGVKGRVVEAHSELYNATAEAGRPKMIGQLLEDSMPELRLLALRLIDRRLLNAQPISDSVRQAMRRRLTDHSAEVRGRAAQLLENLADAKGAQIASGLLLAETDVQVQARFLSLLSRMPREEAVEPALLLIDRPALRGPAASLLVEAERAELLGPTQARRALTAVREHVELADQPEPPVLRLLGLLGEGADQSLLVDQLDHETEAVRRAAAEALAAGEKWPLDPLLDHLDAPTLRPVALDAVGRRGEGPEMIERLLAHEPEEGSGREAWLEALGEVAARLDREGVERLDEMLAERSGSEGLHERLLRAAAGMAEDDQRASAEGLAWVEAALRLGELCRAEGRLDRAAEVYEAVWEQASLEMLEASLRRRLVLGRLKQLLAEGRPLTAATHTRETLEDEQDPPVDSLARCWVDAVRAADEAGQNRTARDLARQTRDLFEGYVAAEAVLSADVLREMLETAEPTPSR